MIADIRGLTIRQPWASLICPGVGRQQVKTIETRTSRWTWTGTVLIHAAAEWAPGWRGRWFSRSDIDGPAGTILEAVGVLDELAEDVNTGEHWRLDRYAQGHVPLGAVIGVADITAALPIYDAERLSDAGLPTPWQPHVTICGDSLNRYRKADTGDGWLDLDISDQLPYGIYEPGRKALLLDNIRSLPEPIPCRGALGPWRPDPALVERVLAEAVAP